MIGTKCRIAQTVSQRVIESRMNAKMCSQGDNHMKASQYLTITCVELELCLDALHELIEGCGLLQLKIQSLWNSLTGEDEKEQTTHDLTVGVPSR